ncbi:uracil-DNA glycosylase family protein [Gemmatimonas sp.]
MLDDLIAIRHEVFRCTRRCDGVACEPERGLRPRGPLIEQRDPASIGALVVGLNPGGSDELEREVLRRPTHATEWESWVHGRTERSVYLERLRRFVDAVGVRGSIIWSNVAKCECTPGRRGLPLLTQRDCAHRFLVRELTAVPKEWIAVAAGLDAYKALAFLSLNRVVLGIPHPTGANPAFSRLWSKDKTLRPWIQHAVQSLLVNGQSSAAWLPDIERAAPP